MSVNTFLGKDINQYVIGKESLEGTCSVGGQIKDTLVTQNLSGIATSLPTHSILYGETDDHYNIHISDNRGNVKPVYYETNKLDDLKKIDLSEINRKLTQLSTSHNNLSEHVTAINTTLTNKDNILSANITSINTKINSLHTVARTGKYTDLENRPEIPTKFKTINNESILGTGNITVSVDSGERNVINEIQINGDSVQPNSNRTVDIQLKTINGKSIVGEGNIEIEGGSSTEVDLSDVVKGIEVTNDKNESKIYRPDNNNIAHLDLSKILSDLIEKVNELYNLAHPETGNVLIIYCKNNDKPNAPVFAPDGWPNITNDATDQQGINWNKNINNLSGTGKIWISTSATKSDSNVWSNFTDPQEYNSGN